MSRVRFIWIAGLMLGLAACEQNRIFEQNLPVDVNGWSYTDPKEYTIVIQETSILYNVFVNVRHADTYRYNNLWVILQTTMPDGSALSDKIQIALALPEGSWTGTCIDGICYHSVLIRSRVTFPQSGSYTLRLVQDMREEPLPGLLDVGIRIERL